MRKRYLFITGLILIVIVVAMAVKLGTKVAAPMQQKTNASNAATTPVGFDKQAYSTTDPKSIWVIVNKQRQLNPKNYTPADLVVPTIPLRSNITSDEEHVSGLMAPSLKQMISAAKEQGVNLNLQSGYRSYNFQTNLYNSYVRTQGQVAADKQSAHPGYSEHQTGLAADLGGVSIPSCNVSKCFAKTIEGGWLTTNAYKYGFIIRYPEDKQNITGYEYEPWHVRYIGAALSNEMHKQGIATLEEFFGVKGGSTYR